MEVVTISNAALSQMRKLSLSTIYISIEQGSCAKHKYSLSFEADHEIYKEYNFEEIRIMIAAHYESLLNSVTIDYISSLITKKFYVASNPIAIRKCGCGMTFSD